MESFDAAPPLSCEETPAACRAPSTIGALTTPARTPSCWDALPVEPPTLAKPLAPSATERPRGPLFPPTQGRRRTQRSTPLGKRDRSRRGDGARAFSPHAAGSAGTARTNAAEWDLCEDVGWPVDPAVPRGGEGPEPSPVTSEAEDSGEDFYDARKVSKRGLTEEGRDKCIEASRRAQRFCHTSAMRRFQQSVTDSGVEVESHVASSFPYAIPHDSPSSTPPPCPTEPMRNSATRFTENDVSVVRAIAMALIEEEEKKRRRCRDQ